MGVQLRLSGTSRSRLARALALSFLFLGLLLLGENSFRLREQSALFVSHGPGLVPPDLLLLGVFVLDALSQQNLRDRIGRDRPLPQPELHALFLEHDLLVNILLERIVVSELFENPAIPRRASIDRIDPEKRSVPAPHPSQSELYCHVVPFEIPPIKNIRDRPLQVTKHVYTLMHTH
jgi:hypothetical protein